MNLPLGAIELSIQELLSMNRELKELDISMQLAGRFKLVCFEMILQPSNLVWILSLILLVHHRHHHHRHHFAWVEIGRQKHPSWFHLACISSFVYNRPPRLDLILVCHLVSWLRNHMDYRAALILEDALATWWNRQLGKETCAQIWRVGGPQRRHSPFQYGVYVICHLRVQLSWWLSQSHYAWSHDPCTPGTNVYPGLEISRQSSGADWAAEYFETPLRQRGAKLDRKTMGQELWHWTITSHRSFSYSNVAFSWFFNKCLFSMVLPDFVMNWIKQLWRNLPVGTLFLADEWLLPWIRWAGLLETSTSFVPVSCWIWSRWNFSSTWTWLNMYNYIQFKCLIIFDCWNV